MSGHQQPSPTNGIHHGALSNGVVHPNGHMQVHGQHGQPKSTAQVLSSVNEEVWLHIGNLSELMGDLDGAVQSYERALQHNYLSVRAMSAIASIYRSRDNFQGAVQYLKEITKLEPNNGDVWGSLGHCFLMMDDLQQAYSAYQQALYHLQDPKEPKLWYGIGILYDRYGSLEHAEEAFSQVMRMDPTFEKANEIYFRLGIIYKQQQKYQQSLECFKYIVQDPPRPLTEEDIWFQIGHVYEQQKDYEPAKDAYRRVLQRDPKHAKVLQQLGWLYHQQSNTYASQDQAIEYLEQSVNSDQTDAQSWYLLGRCYMSQQKYPKAYEAYQQAVYRDGRNPTFWCSIGVLYYQINQYRDALDAYSRAIRLNPNISEVWYDLGTLYESCNNQTADALDAYQRAADLDPSNVHIKARLQLLQNGQPTNGMPNQNSAPLPQDVHPQAYQAPGVNGPPGPQWAGSAPAQAPQGPGIPPSFSYGGERNRLADIQPPTGPPPGQQPPNPYDQRDSRPMVPPRAPSPPRHEPMRQYQEQPPPGPGPRRGLSPSPKSHPAAPTAFRPPPGPPNGPIPPALLPQQGLQPNRITNPNFSTHSSSVPPPPINPLNAPPPPNGPNMGYGRMASPPPEVRPILENRPLSAGGSFQQPYQHHPTASTPGGIAGGAPPPAAALAAAEAAARDREDRTPLPNGPKRAWEDDNSQKSSDEKRVRLDDGYPPRRPTPQDRPLTPPKPSPQEAEARRLEDQRRANDGYHPSEAAHHPPSLPAMQQLPVQPPQAPEPPKEERRDEPAARKIDVDEDYDDDGDDQKPRIGSQRNSPRSGANGIEAKA